MVEKVEGKEGDHTSCTYTESKEKEEEGNTKKKFQRIYTSRNLLPQVDFPGPFSVTAVLSVGESAPIHVNTHPEITKFHSLNACIVCKTFHGIKNFWFPSFTTFCNGSMALNHSPTHTPYLPHSLTQFLSPSLLSSIPPSFHPSTLPPSLPPSLPHSLTLLYCSTSLGKYVKRGCCLRRKSN